MNKAGVGAAGTPGTASGRRAPTRAGEERWATVSAPTSDFGRNAADRRGESDGHDPRPPAAETEQAIGEIWCEVLGIPEVGPDDNFFGLGGNSLNAMQAVARVRRTMACPQLKLADVFRAATLRELAQRVETLSSCAQI